MMKLEKNLLKSLKSRKVIVWALFDDAQCSYKKAIEEYFSNENIEVYSIGINNVNFPESDKFFYKKIDLSLTNPNLFKKLNKLPQPNIILASPPCEAWSGADCKARMTNSIDSNGCWMIKNSKFYDEYNIHCHKNKRRSFLQKEKTRIIGENTIGATIAIIREYVPNVWVIENPQTSLSWKFQKYHWDFHGYENLTYYSAYDKNFSLKPTIFKSNIKLLLKSERVQGNKDHMAKGSYKKRSSIPSLVIKSIFMQCLVNNTPKWDDPVRCRKIMEQWKDTENYKYCIDLLTRLAKE